MTEHAPAAGPVFGAQFWDERYRSAQRVWSGNPNPQLVAEVAGRPPGRALDVGCGEGADAIWLAGQGWTVVAADISGVALERAADHAQDKDPAAAARITWRQVDLLAQPPEPDSFDLVSAQFMQLPPEARARLFTSLAAAVRNGGLLLVVGHHPSDLGTGVPRPQLPEVFYGPEEIAGLLGKSWTIQVCEARPRPARTADGNDVTVHDTILLATRSAVGSAPETSAGSPSADRIERIKCCLNGQRAAAEHEAVPLAPAEVAQAAAAAAAAGAEAVHVHPRDGKGMESLAASDVGATVLAIRQACPGLPIGVTTGLWVARGDPAARQRAVAAWAELEPAARPDFASINVGEPGCAELADALRGAGIGVEAGVWSTDDAQALAAGVPGGGVLRIMVEVLGTPAASACARADEILAVLDAAALDAPRLLHGADETCWPLVEHAGRLGIATRIGLEDITTGPDGEQVADNAELVTRALRVWEAARS